jgi:hypothetical protein
MQNVGPKCEPCFQTFNKSLHIKPNMKNANVWITSSQQKERICRGETKNKYNILVRTHQM